MDFCRLSVYPVVGNIIMQVFLRDKLELKPSAIVFSSFLGTIVHYRLPTPQRWKGGLAALFVLIFIMLYNHKKQKKNTDK